MHTTIPFAAAALVSVAIIVIGIFYIAAPARISRSFGLEPPSPDANTWPWLRLKGIRDVACGLAVLALMLGGDNRSVGLVLVALAVIPLGDMSNILASGGSKTTAFSVHGVTCAVMVFAGLLLIHAI